MGRDPVARPSSGPGMWPPDDSLLAAWRDLAADPTAGGAFAELTLAPLTADLARVFPRLHPDDAATAAGGAVRTRRGAVSG